MVSILSTLSIFGAWCMDAAPLGGAGGCFRAFVFCCTKRGRACDTSNERANALHAANERRRAASSSSHVGAVVHVVYIRGGLFLLLVWYSLNAAGVSVFGCPRCPYSGGVEAFGFSVVDTDTRGVQSTTRAGRLFSFVCCPYCPRCPYLRGARMV